MRAAASPEPQLVHEALLYRDVEDFLAGTVPFVDEGLAAGEPVMIAVPRPRLDALRTALGRRADSVRLADMTSLGRNPARIIPELRDWIEEHRGRRLRFIGEPLWPGRTEREAVEAVRHEALLNLAFAGAPVAILCPYDASGLGAQRLADAERTHPAIVSGGRRRASAGYDDPVAVYTATGRELPPPAGPVSSRAVTEDLAGLRAFVREHAARARLGAQRQADLLVAANEAVANTLRHGGRRGVMRLWHDEHAFVCEVADGGRIDDPLAGRRRPRPEEESGRGLWLMNQLCDLVELRPEPGGTTLRLHMRLA